MSVPSKNAKEACFVRENGSFAVCSFRTTDGVTWVFPAGHLVAAQGADDGENLRILYTGAEVVLKGTLLQKVRDAIARGHTFAIRAVNPAFRSEYEDEVFVTSVRVIEAKPPKGDVDGDGAT
jgi:hypothetical protein